MDGQEAVDRVLEFLEEGCTCAEVASKLGDLAIRFGSSDNVTVVVVTFDHHIHPRQLVASGSTVHT